MTSDPMMQPGRWNNGVPTPNYATPLLDFSPMGKMTDKLAGQMKPTGNTQGQPLQLTPGPNQAQPQGVAGGMNGMANTANAMPWASALMRMFGGQGSVAQPQTMAMPSIGTPGGVNPFSGSPIY